MTKLKEWLKLYHARNWMNRNRSFLPTWHAYIGYSMNLFDLFATEADLEDVAVREKLDVKLLAAWVETGVILGHLHKTTGGKFRSTSHMMTYMAGSSEYSVGALLKEMMELHIPSLLHYPEMMRGESKLIYQDEAYGGTVAETSSYLEKLAYPKLVSWIQQQKPQSVLDIGCGHAGYLIRLAKRFPKLDFIGIEKNQKVYEQAQSNVQREHLDQVKIIQTDIEEWNEETYSIDLIMLNNILYYFNPSQRKALFQRLHHILRTKGTLSIISPIHPTRQGQSFSSAFNIFMTSHENLYTLPSEGELRALAKENGFIFRSMIPIIREGSWYFITLVKV